MTKTITVKYGKDTYTKNALDNDKLISLGLRLQPKIACLTASLGALFANKYVETENPFSYYQCVKDIFDPEDWKWFFDNIIYDLDKPIKVNERFLVKTEEIDEHFAGDFIRLYTLTLQFMYKNLGEWQTLIESSSGLAENIAVFLKDVLESKMDEMKMFFQSYVEQEKAGKKTLSKAKK